MIARSVFLIATAGILIGCSHLEPKGHTWHMGIVCWKGEVGDMRRSRAEMIEIQPRGRVRFVRIGDCENVQVFFVPPESLHAAEQRERKAHE